MVCAIVLMLEGTLRTCEGNQVVFDKIHNLKFEATVDVDVNYSCLKQVALPRSLLA